MPSHQDTDYHEGWIGEALQHKDQRQWCLQHVDSEELQKLVCHHATDLMSSGHLIFQQLMKYLFHSIFVQFEGMSFPSGIWNSHARELCFIVITC